MSATRQLNGGGAKLDVCLQVRCVESGERDWEVKTSQICPRAKTCNQHTVTEGNRSTYLSDLMTAVIERSTISRCEKI